MKQIISIVLIVIVNCQLSIVNSQETLDDYKQHTSWGVATGVNLLHYNLNLESTVGAPDKTKPGIGAEMGLFLDFHISPSWAIRMAPSAGLEHINLYKDNENGHLVTFATEFALSIEYTINCGLSTINFNLGPYSHFVIASTLYGSDHLTNPYSRTIASDPITEEPTFAIGDLNAGFAFSVAYQLPSLWFVQLDFKYDVNDILNADSHRLYVQPFKAILSIGHRFM